MRRIFIEREKCMACLTCRDICINVRRAIPGNFEDFPVDTDIESRNHMSFSGGASTPVFCRHCDEPECVATCMSGALHKCPESGHIRYDKERCGKCFMCVMSCPFGMPKPDRATRTEVIRCTFCFGIADNPSCATACPTGTISVREVAAE